MTGFSLRNRSPRLHFRSVQMLICCTTYGYPLSARDWCVLIHTPSVFIMRVYIPCLSFIAHMVMQILVQKNPGNLSRADRYLTWSEMVPLRGLKILPPPPKNLLIENAKFTLRSSFYGQDRIIFHWSLQAASCANSPFDPVMYSNQHHSMYF